MIKWFCIIGMILTVIVFFWSLFRASNECDRAVEEMMLKKNNDTYKNN